VGGVSTGDEASSGRLFCRSHKGGGVGTWNAGVIDYHDDERGVGVERRTDLYLYQTSNL